jgi:hypothetical protein
MRGTLRIRPVRRYRRPRYPGALVLRRPGTTRRRRGLAAAVVPLAAGGLATLDGCWGVAGDMQYTYVTRYLTEAEARAVIDDELRTSSARPAGPCDALLLGDRLQQDLLFEHPTVGSYGPVRAEIDLLAPAQELPAEGTCPAAQLAAVGVEFTTDAAGDDESVSGDPDGLTAAERQALDRLRTEATAAMLVLSDQDFPYEVEEGTPPDATAAARAPAEDELRVRVRQFVDELRRDGLI